MFIGYFAVVRMLPRFYHIWALQGRKGTKLTEEIKIPSIKRLNEWPRISPEFLRARIRAPMSLSFCHITPLPHSWEDPSQMTLGPCKEEQILKILSGNFRIPKCVKENVQFIYTVAVIVKTVVLSQSRTVSSNVL